MRCLEGEEFLLLMELCGDRYRLEVGVRANRSDMLSGADINWV